jgi:hypothetical protein
MCMSRATLTGSGTLCIRSAFLVPLSDASKSFFFFPMVLRWRAAVVGVEVSVLWEMPGTMSIDF